MSAKAEEKASEQTAYARFYSAAFLEAMRTLAAITTEVRVELDQNGLRVAAVDPAHVAYIRLSLPAKEGPTDSVVFGVNAEAVLDFVRIVMRSSLASPWVDLRVHGSATPRLTVIVGRMSKQFEFVDPAGIPQPSHLDLPGEKAAARVEAVGLRDALKTLSNRDDYVSISLTPAAIGAGGLIVSSDADDETWYRVDESQLEDVKEIAPLLHPDAKSMFPTSYLQSVLEAHADAGGKVTLSVGSDYPLRMLWSAGGGDVEVLVAPRITNEG